MYNLEIPKYADVISVEDFINYCNSNFFIDYDGHGNLVKGNKMSNVCIVPSTRHLIPDECTHIAWFNK